LECCHLTWSARSPAAVVDLQTEAVPPCGLFGVAGQEVLVAVPPTAGEEEPDRAGRLAHRKMREDELRSCVT